MKQLPLGLRESEAPDFDTFLAGANAAAVSHLERIAEDDPPGASFGSPSAVYLWGPEGSGKTHLLRSLARARERHGARVGWFSARDSAAWPYDEAWTLVVIDDCESLSPSQQQWAFHHFVEAATQGATIAAAGRLPPVDLPLRDDLRSRLGWGPVFAIEPLSETQAREALAAAAQRRGIALSQDVVDYLLNHFARDLKNLMALFDRLDDFALSNRRNLTVPLLRQMLFEETA